MTARTALLLALAAAAAPSGQRDRADPPAAWHATASDGVAAQVSGVATAGGKALRLAYDFGAVSGYAVARRSLPIDWPDNYVIRLRLRGRGGVNDLQLKFVDASGANVWWVQRRAVRPSPDWQDIVIRPRDVTFAWGPSADHRLRHTAAIELVVVRGRDGGAGHVDLDALTLTPLPPARPLAAPVASEPAVLDGRTDTAWRTRGGGALVFDFGGMREVGGLLLHWQPGAGASRYVVEASDDRRHWRVVRRVTRGDGGDDPVTLADVETRHLRLTLPADAPPAALGEAVVEPREWSATPNDLVAALAHAEPRGTFPRGFSGEQPYWTLVGTDGGADSGLLGEDGAIEVARGGFSIEPFVVERRHRFDWAGVATHQSLERGYLPLPHVGWTAPGWTLDSAVFADATAPRLLARWRLANTGAAPRTLRLVLAVRPFQVNPPAQFLGLPGGVSPIAAIRWARDRLVVTTPPAIDGDPAVDRVLRPLDPPTAVATAPFDAGGLARPATLDGPDATTDPQHLASAALSWTVTLAPGERRDVAMTIPFSGDPAPLDAAAFDRAHDATVAAWTARLDRVRIALPASAPPLGDTVRTATADMLMSRTGAALKPGTRAYDRSWIRDGTMIADALLRLGLDRPAGAFADWYAGKLFADGKVPCCVDGRGPDPVAENDAPGEFIHLLVQHYRYTGDRDTLERLWPRLDAARRYMDRQVGSTRTAANRAPDRRMLYGLMPPSISHEGYSSQPQYSLWDDFWTLAGYKDAAWAAARLGRPDAPAIAAARDRFAADLHAAIAAAVAHWRIDYIPGATSLGDFDATSTTMALDPADDAAALDPALLARTFERQWQRVVARSAPGADWSDYTPYEWRNVTALVRLGERARAGDLIAAYMADRRPLAWNGWAEVVGRDPRAVRFIGDMPHAWVASDFVRAALDLFAYDRQSDATLVLGAGLQPSWLAKGGASIEGLRTPYGTLDLAIRTDPRQLSVTIGGTARPPGGFVLPWPLARRPGAATIDGRRVTVTAAGLAIPAGAHQITVAIAR